MTIQPGAPLTYQPFPGDNVGPIQETPWAGTHVVVLTLSPSRDPVVMGKIVSALDAAYSEYALITGRTPVSYGTIDGLLTLAELPDNPSYTFAEQGYLGFTGIEFQTTYFNLLYDDVRNTNTYDQGPFYELGRNFWFYGDQLGAVDAFVTGFAIVNRFISMQLAGLPGGPFGSMDFSTFRNSILVDLVNTAFASGNYSLENTIAAGVAPNTANHWSSADLAGALLYQVFQDGGLGAYQAFYADLAKLPKATTAQAAIDNFVSAASQALGVDASFLHKQVGQAFQSPTLASLDLAAERVWRLEASLVSTQQAGASHTFTGSAGREVQYLIDSSHLVETGQSLLVTTLKALPSLAQDASSVATLAYEFFTGSVPSAAGMDYLVSPTGPNLNNLNSSYYQSFNLENRYINFGVNLGKNGAGAANFAAHYGALSLFEATRQAYATLFGDAPSDTKLHALLDPGTIINGPTVTRAEYFAIYGGDGPNGIGAKAAMVGWLMAEAVKADLGTYALSNDAFLTDVALHNAPFGVDIIGHYAQPGFVFHPG
jgi:hypothetical protein